MLFTKKTSTETTTQELIDALNTHMFSLEPDSPEYDKCLNQKEKLTKSLSLETNDKFKISPDVLVTVAANLAGILLILNHERLHVATSKALSFVIKPKA